MHIVLIAKTVCCSFVNNGAFCTQAFWSLMTLMYSLQSGKSSQFFSWNLCSKSQLSTALHYWVTWNRQTDRRTDRRRAMPLGRQSIIRMLWWTETTKQLYSPIIRQQLMSKKTKQKKQINYAQMSHTHMTNILRSRLGQCLQTVYKDHFSSYNIYV